MKKGDPLKKIHFIKNMRQVKPFISRDGAEVHELINPKNTKIKRLSIARGTLNSSQAAKPHYHKKSEEIYYILDGIGRIKLNDNEFDIITGDVIFVPKKMVHCLKNLSQREELRVLAIESPPYSDDDIFFV